MAKKWGGILLTSNLDRVVDLRRLEGGDLARVIAGIAFFGHANDQIVAILLGFQLVAIVLLHHLFAHGQDGIAFLPQKNEAL